MSRRQEAEEGAYLNRYVTDEQRSRRLIFSSTPRAVQHWRFWGVARSTRIDLDMGLRSRLPKSPTLRRRHYTSLGLGALMLLICVPWSVRAEGKRPGPAKTVDSSSSENDLESAPAPKVNDPFRGFNRTVFKFNDRLVTYAVRPLAHGYVLVVPIQIRDRVTNFFDNLGFPVRFVNCVLQGKITRSAQEVGKFVVNTTAGVGGLFRVSDHISSLADVHAEDFGQTLGVWGIPPGPYLVIPLLGPSNCRDIVGFAADYVLYPLNWYPFGIIHHSIVSNAVTLALSITRTVNGTPKAVDTYDKITSGAVDPYVAVRDGYLSYREAQIKK